jgi:hypothetical protein
MGSKNILAMYFSGKLIIRAFERFFAENCSTHTAFTIRLPRYERAMNYAQHVSISSDHSLYHAAQKWMVEHGKATDIHYAQRILDNPLSQEYHTSIREFTEFVVNDNAMLRNARDNHSGMVNTGSLEQAQNYTFHDSNFRIDKDVETKIKAHASEQGMLNKLCQ